MILTKILPQQPPDLSEGMGASSELKMPGEAFQSFEELLKDPPEDDPDDGLSTPDVSQPLGDGSAQRLPDEAQQLPVISASAAGEGNLPGSHSPAGQRATGDGGVQSNGVSWPVADAAAGTAVTETHQATPLDSGPRLTSMSARPGIEVDSSGTATMPVGLEIQRVEMALQAGRILGTDARAMLASSNQSPESTSPGIIRSMTAMALRGGGTMRLRLDPPSLGELVVQLNVLRGRLTIQIEATMTSGANALAAESAALRASLEQRGFGVERFVISGPRGIEINIEHSQLDENEQDDDQAEHEGDRNHGSRDNSMSTPAETALEDALRDMLELEHGADE